MPFLKFKCESCGKVFDELVKLSDVEALRCPDCGGRRRRQNHNFKRSKGAARC